ncbi:hypothetical protein Q5P01_015441 [Channa striata]|uniref:Secreted protein n=1 Tax=Channa striata TaxID=64152 RepID=A0AA88MIK0_CHASR|nr:hypothetical protein Q5P01_015441 [Channa striata]
MGLIMLFSQLLLCCLTALSLTCLQAVCLQCFGCNIGGGGTATWSWAAANQKSLTAVKLNEDSSYGPASQHTASL